MRVFFLTEGTRTSPASRIRVYNHLERLAGRTDFEARAVSFTGEAACRALVDGKKPCPPLRAAEKLRQLAAWSSLRGAARRSDVLFVQRVLPPAGTIARLARLKTPLVYDFDDAVYLGRAEREMRFRAVIRAAASVIAVSRFAADEAIRRGAAPERVTVIPSPVDCAAVARRPAGGTGESSFTVGWIGSPATTSYLEAVWPELAAFAADCPRARFLFVGARPFDTGTLKERVRFETWSEEKNRTLPAQMDAGIMPLPDDPWCRGKGGYKLIQYMSAGVACLASPVGANLEVVEDGVCGFFAAQSGDWRRHLARLADNPALCDSLGAAGRQRAETVYDYAVTSGQFLSALQQAAACGRTPDTSTGGVTPGQSPAVERK
ncbi:glycosyltransferase family 4 protein [bacterium]|nr:glycosyltransferase family 4 protein [bacterium]